MRIGEVSRQYHISVDNLYYYINYGLLVPPKPRGQYIFNKTVLQDLEWILELKELDFTLREIHMLLFSQTYFRTCRFPGHRRIKGCL